MESNYRIVSIALIVAFDIAASP